LPRLVSLWRDRGTRKPGSAAGKRAPFDEGAAPSLSRTEIESVGAALLRLQRGLTGKRGLAGAPYMDDPDLLGAYLLYYWPVSYAEASLAIAELALRPRRVLDLGSGPGPAAAAAIDMGADEAILMDGSERALELASRLLKRDGVRVATSCVDLESADALSKESGPFDLVILGHSLNELWRERDDRVERRTELLERAARLLSPGGALLAIEPALLETSREALALRDALAARDHRILGPCPARASGPYRCPALASGPDRTCHSEAAWEAPEPVASLAAQAGLDRRSVKYAWFAAGAASVGAGTAAPLDARPAAWTAAQRADAESIEGRVVSDSMLNKAGRVRYFICSEGSLVSLSAARTAPGARAAGFFSLRRGDRVRVRGAEQRAGGGLGLVPGSSLGILARAPEIG